MTVAITIASGYMKFFLLVIAILAVIYLLGGDR